MPRALLFDLDETLVVEEEAVAESFAATARAAAERRLLDAATLARDARSCARELWRAAPTHPYCARIGISSWEGLCCRFAGNGPQLEALRAWAPRYRRRAWADSLARQSIDDLLLAEDLGERFAAERRARHAVFDDAVSALTSLGQSHALALVTNGASCLQREKLAASGLGEHFDAVVVSGDIGAGKPDAAIFRHALAALGASAGEAVMIGDNLERDVDGAIAAGLEAVWINRRGDPRPEGRRGVVEIATLAELSAALAR